MHDSEERYPPPMCHPGTREVVIFRMKEWYGFLTRPDKPIMWVHAPAGYGKTAIAGTISKMLGEVEGLNFNPLGATFYFWRTATERNSPTRFIVTIAYQLAMSIPELAPHIKNAIEQNRLILRKTLEAQLVKLIVEPFRALGNLENMPNRLIVIDGIDECIGSAEGGFGDQEKQQVGDHEAAQIRILELIQALQSYQLPLSFLVLSRPEAWIKQHMQSPLLKRIVEEVDLYMLGDHLNDAEKYIRDELARIAARIGVDAELEGQEQWPGENLVQEFIRRTDGHMLYASIVIRHIENPYEDPRDMLRSLYYDGDPPSPDLAHSSPHSSIYELYRQILQSCPVGNWQRMIEVLEDLGAVFWHLLDGLSLQCAVGILDCLAGRVPGQGFRALRPLHAVLHLSCSDGPRSKSNVLSSPYIHSTFSSFLQEPCTSLGLPINRNKGCQRLLRGSLDCMSKITPQTEINKDSVVYALRIWPSLIMSGWLHRTLDPRCFEAWKNQYLEVCKKLVTIDLSTCVIKVLSTDRPLSNMWFQGGICRTGLENAIVPYSARSIFERDPLVQQAVAHVSSSHEAAVLHFLEQPSDVWPQTLTSCVTGLMGDLKEDLETGRALDGVNRVVQALERLQRERPEDARRLGLGREEDFSSFLCLTG